MKGHDVSATTKLKIMALVKGGVSVEVICERMGLSVSTVQRIAAHARRIDRIREVLAQ